MADQGEKDRALAKLEAIDHPLRLAIFTALSLRSASTKELAKELKAPLGKVRYQLNRLRTAGIAELKEERQRRGVAERIYAVHAEPLSEAELMHLSGSQREKVITGILKAIFGDALKALRAGLFASRDDFVVARLPMSLDEQGWAEAVAIHRRAQVELIEAGTESRRRIEDGGPAVADALAFLLLFEMGRPAPAGR